MIKIPLRVSFPQTEGGTNDTDAIVAGLDLDPEEFGDEDLMNLLQTDEEDKSQPTEPFEKANNSEWNNLFEDENPSSNGQSEHNSNLEEILKPSTTDSLF